MLCIAEVIFGIAGLGFSLFYGCYYRQLWMEQLTPEQVKTKGWQWRFWQFWQNFVCSAIGWAIAFYYVFCRLRSPQFVPQVGDSVPILVALLGIIGFLPWALRKATKF
jgi:hypothetical protein